jgi:hypothetical protein
MDDERERERALLRDVIGGEGEDHRSLEHPDGRGSRRDDEREARGDNRQESRSGREPEVEPKHHEPKGHAQEGPREDRQGHGEQPEA